MQAFAQLFQFISFFRTILHLNNEDIDIELIEEELLGIAPLTTIPKILLNMLLILSHIKREVTPETLDKVAWTIYNQRGFSVEENPFGRSTNEDDLSNFQIMSPVDKINILHQLSQWIALSSSFRDKIETILSQDASLSPTSFRVDPIGWKGEFGIYYLLDDNRLYYLQDKPPNLSHVDPNVLAEYTPRPSSRRSRRSSPMVAKTASVAIAAALEAAASISTASKRHASAVSAKSESGPKKKRRKVPLTAVGRRRLAKAAMKRRNEKAANPELEDEEEDDDQQDSGAKEEAIPEPEDVPVYLSMEEALAQETPVDEQIWECVCVTLKDWEEFIASLKTSKNEYDRQLYKYLKENLLPVLREDEEKRISAAKSRLRSREKQFLVVHRKRSSRIEEKQSRIDYEAEKRLQVEQLLHEEQLLKERERRLKQRDERRVQEQALLEEKIAREKLQKEAKVSAKILEAKGGASAAVLIAAPHIGAEESNSSSVDTSAQNSRSSSPTASSASRSTRSSSRLAERHQANKVLGKEEASEPVTKKVHHKTETWDFDCYCGEYGRNYDDGTPVVACSSCDIWMHVECLRDSEKERLQIAKENEEILKKKPQLEKIAEEPETNQSAEGEPEPKDEIMEMVKNRDVQVIKSEHDMADVNGAELSTDFICDRCLRIKNSREQKEKREARKAQKDAEKAARQAERTAARAKAKKEAKAREQAELLANKERERLATLQASNNGYGSSGLNSFVNQSRFAHPQSPGYRHDDVVLISDNQSSGNIAESRNKLNGIPETATELPNAVNTSYVDTESVQTPQTTVQTTVPRQVGMNGTSKATDQVPVNHTAQGSGGYGHPDTLAPGPSPYHIESPLPSTISGYPIASPRAPTAVASAPVAHLDPGSVVSAPPSSTALLENIHPANTSIIQSDVAVSSDPTKVNTPSAVTEGKENAV